MPAAGAAFIAMKSLQAQLFHPPLREMKPPIGMSACLWGDAVRYDGASKQNKQLRDFFATHA